MTDEATRIMSDAEMDAAEQLAEARLAAAREQPADSFIEMRLRDMLARPYRLEVRGDAVTGYLAWAPALPGCVTAGETPEEALAMLRDAMAGWLEAALVAGDPIPEHDQPEDRHGGRMLIRMPKSLHRLIAESAEREGVSANQYVVTLLAAGVGQFAAPRYTGHPAGAWPAWRERFLMPTSPNLDALMAKLEGAGVHLDVTGANETILKRLLELADDMHPTTTVDQEEVNRKRPRTPRRPTTTR